MEDGVKVHLQNCGDCGRESWRLFSVNVRADFSSGFSSVSRICARCRRIRYFRDGKSNVDCRLCGKELKFGRDGRFSDRAKECRVCGSVFCVDCWKVPNMVLCLDMRSHWIQYAC
jgi:hypothetical protein